MRNSFTPFPNKNLEVFDRYITNEKSSGNLLASPAAIGDYQLTFTAGHGAVVDDVVTIQEGGHTSQAEITAVATNLITLDTRLDHAFTTAADVYLGAENIALNGSMASPVICRVKPAPEAIISVSRMIITITDDTAMDDAKFGGITALANGIVLRKYGDSGSFVKNFCNIKSNNEFALRTYDLTYSDKAPAGVYGLRTRRTFAGDEKQATFIRLDGSRNDELQIVIQDDLTGLTSMNAVAQGNIARGG